MVKNNSKLFRNGRKKSKTVQNAPKWSKIYQECLSSLDWSKMTKNSPKYFEIVRNGLELFKRVPNDHNTSQLVTHVLN